jgi:Ca2+-transporting ATPase
VTVDPPSRTSTVPAGEPTDPTRGLQEAEARRRLGLSGFNELPATARRGAWGLLRDVLAEPMFLLLVACGAIYLALGDRQEALMLLGFVLVVVSITYVQRRRTERSLEALRDLSSPRALVVRDGAPRRIPGREVVAGDVVLLSEGDRVPADLLLVEASNVSVDESLLTGESAPVTKHASQDREAAANGEDTRVFAGTLVTQGTARGIVQATGARSALGRIGASLGAIEADPTPVQKEMLRIVRWVAVAGLAVAAALVLAHGLSRGDWLNALLAGLTFAMAILPEELPVVLTIFLGLGAWRLARERVLTRSMPAVEVLGATTVLCVDKTGTLTQNRMAVRQLWVDGAVQALPEGAPPGLPEAFHPVLEYGVLASRRRPFDPMEVAIAQTGQRHLAGTEHLHADWELVDDYPLSRAMLAMSRVWQSPDREERLVASKGAPEAIVDLCHLPAGQAQRILEAVTAMARDGLRVLGVARAIFPGGAMPAIQHDFDFEFVGLLGLEDPVRPDVRAAIAECRAAGIRVVMITGDHPQTALSIARQAGLAGSDAYLTGADLDALDEAALAARLAGTQVFCRVQPEQKLRLVRAFRARGDVVAMTGDGVNDAPALKAAHIGVAMGARGTDVAREAAALVLLNDDFASLVTAVRHGRRVFANLRKAIAFVIAAHVPIVGLSILPVLLGWPLVLLPVHIVFLQLIIDPACSIVFEAEPPEADAMQAPPRPPHSRLFDAQVLQRGLLQGAGLLVLVLVAYGVASRTASHDVARAVAFCALVLSNLALIQANRAWGLRRDRGATNPAFAWIALGTCALLALVLTVPAVASLFAFAIPAPRLLAVAAGLALLGLFWFEGVKRLPGSRVAGIRPKA